MLKDSTCDSRHQVTVRTASTRCGAILGHTPAWQRLQEVKVWESLRPTVGNGRLQSMSLQEQPHLQSRHDQTRHGVPRGGCVFTKRYS